MVPTEIKTTGTMEFFVTEEEEVFIRIMFRWKNKTKSFLTTKLSKFKMTKIQNLGHLGGGGGEYCQIVIIMGISWHSADD